MIELKDVCKTYKYGKEETKALDNINLTIKDGEFVAVIGNSGSGKSTLLNVIGCMDLMDSGSYILNGQEISGIKINKLHKARKESISFVFQNFALLNHYTVFENVEVPLLAKKVRKSERKRIVKEKLELMGIYDLKSKLPTKISGGQQQRCAIARALASDNNIILADEPTGALDSKTGEEIINVLKQLNGMGKTVIIVTHNMDIAKQTDRILEMEDGRIRDIDLEQVTK
ncbi:ABC transporter ATP-binding protein [Bovifimicola ammoniilytica]|jgi:putative ABC transport system ATP-binding protein|uniref:ABC transporter ATP-binding protein n=1 Tax=Bovifimicola ammoniilytica TaxID=2981720 RepID=UPI0003413E09|nr:ABC transporter ATP-binding protein [Bovifimicola ammoniilytica]MCU6752532.1 ABC transporter ATP-binding protein [Bovifimicola ammoniilytica]CCZ04690.1 aBC transporter related protein [Eubacterium sp. CAG:603]SCJ28084.1 Macrolide export ATP-binding/permease protein MacB [uncultured Eubacterium sp.]